LTNLRKNIGDDLELFTCQICRNCCRYCHFNTMTVSVDFDTSHEDSVRLECLATELEQWLSRDVINVSKLLEKAGYAIIEYDTAEEQVDQAICLNDYLFTEKGRIPLEVLRFKTSSRLVHLTLLRQIYPGATVLWYSSRIVSAGQISARLRT